MFFLFTHISVSSINIVCFFKSTAKLTYNASITSFITGKAVVQCPAPGGKFRNFDKYRLEDAKPTLVIKGVLHEFYIKNKRELYNYE